MTVWQRFRSWRRTRPFWGGVLTVLAGLEIVVTMNLELHGGTISFGPEKFTGYLIAFVLVLCGLLGWFTPAQRHFYGLVATFVAIYSLLGVNLGGFFVGMLLGIAGGGLIFAWNPAPDSSPSDDSAEESPRHAAIIAVLALSVTMLTATPGKAIAGPCATPSPSPSASSGGGIIGDIIDFFDKLFGGGGKPSPTPTPTPKPTSTACPTPTPTGSASPGDPGIPGIPGVPGVPGLPGVPGQAKLLKPVAGQPNVGKRPSRMTGTRVTMQNLVFQGVVDLPTTDGPIRVLKFTMAQSDTNDFLLHVYGDKGWDTDLKSSKLTVRGGTVDFYTSRFRGNLFGLIPVDFTPTSLPPPIPLPLVFFTNPDVQLVWVNSPVLEAPKLRINLVRAS
ncbi:MAG TPA: hypothetical protein DGG94_02455 [Micromonosporaceae bacterium]|nr:hypothetical protein [Micromonosporaceae bacterium]HCU48682.1 hypothetical protein [Micromonosporaceae bacterium]